jgi:protocatechuate 3,4-dioxygenase beta subunit
MRAKLALCLFLTARALRAGEITGRVALDNKPAAGVNVAALPAEQPADFARREARREPQPAALAKAVTNARGEFRIVFEVPRGQPGVVVSLSYSGVGLTESWAPGRFDTADVEDAGEITARKGFSLSGRIVDAEGRPLPDAEVEHPTGPGSARTDADGRFVLEGVAESGNDVVASKPGFVAARASNVRGGSSDRTMAMRRGLPLVGAVVAADGTTPVPGAVVRVDGRDTHASAEADAEGRFRIEEFGEGHVSVLADGGERGVCEVTGVALPRPADSVLKLVLAPAKAVNGRLLDATTRKPVAGAVVDVTAGRRRLWTRSGADGTFTVRPAPAGDWRLAVSAPRYVRTNRSIARAQLGEKPVEVFLREGATITGRVTDDQRRPVTAAKVRAVESENRGLSGAPTAVTAEDGTFTLRRVPAVEALRLVVTHADFEPASLGDLGLKPGEARAGIAFSLRRGAVLTGVVTAGDAPLGGVQMYVTVSRAGFGAPPRSIVGPMWSWPRVTTGPDGRFRIGGLAPGEYSVTAAKTGYARETKDVVVADGRGPEPLAFALESEAVIAGSARGKRGTGVPDQTVTARAADAASRSSSAARTLADGSFRIEGLKPGVSYNLFVSSAGSNAPRKTVAAPAEGVEIVLAGMGRIAGRVVDAEGRPVPEFQVSAQTDKTSGGSGWVNPIRQDVSSETGEFIVENAPAGALEVRVVAKGYQAARVGGIAVEEGETRAGVEVKLVRGATLHGRVVEARSGRPVPEVDVSTDSAPAGVTTDADGAFSIEGVTPGKARVTARGPEYATASEFVEVAETGGTVELKLSPGASVSAAVVSPSGEPQAGAEATLAQAGQNYGGTKAVAGPDGRVKYSHLSPGRYALTAGSGGRRSKPVDVALETDQARDDVRVVMGGGATVLVTVTGLSPEDRRQLEVGVAWASTYVPAKELPDGRFEARDVAAGRVEALGRVGAFGVSNVRLVSRPVTVPDEGSVDVEVPFEAGFALTVHVLRDGQGVEGANVFASPTTGKADTPGFGTTDASGNVRITGLKPGAYRVSAVAFASSSIAPEQRVDLAGDLALEIVFPSGRVAGRVVASGSGQPLADAQVRIHTTNADGSFGLTHDATTDDTGRFQLNGLEAGPLTLTAQRKGYVVETRSVMADSSDELVIELARGDGLDVTGRDGLLGTPLGSFSARVFDGAGAELATSYVRLDSSGRGEIPSLNPGSYSILASASGFASTVFDGVPIPGPALAVSLTPGGTLDIDVPPERLTGGPLACLVVGPRGLPLAFRQWGNRGNLSLAGASTHLTNFPAVSGTLTCPGVAPVPFAVPEGGTARIAVK